MSSYYHYRYDQQQRYSLSSARDFEWFTARPRDEYEEPLKNSGTGSQKPTTSTAPSLMNFKLLDLTSWDEQDLDLPHSNSTGTDGAVVDDQEIQLFYQRGPSSRPRNEPVWIDCTQDVRQDYEDDDDYCEYFDLTALSSDDVANLTVSTTGTGSTAESSKHLLRPATLPTSSPRTADYYDLTELSSAEDDEDQQSIDSRRKRESVRKQIVDLTRNTSHMDVPHVDLTGAVQEEDGSVIYDLTHYELANSSSSSSSESMDQEDQDNFPTLLKSHSGVSSHSYDSSQAPGRSFQTAVQYSHSSMIPGPTESAASASTAARNVRWLEPLVQEIRSMDAPRENTSRIGIPRNDSSPILMDQDLLNTHIFSESRDEEDHQEERDSRATAAYEIPFTSTTSTDEGESRRTRTPTPTPKDSKQESSSGIPYAAAASTFLSLLGWNTSKVQCPAPMPDPYATNKTAAAAEEVAHVHMTTTDSRDDNVLVDLTGADDDDDDKDLDDEDLQDDIEAYGTASQSCDQDDEDMEDIDNQDSMYQEDQTFETQDGDDEVNEDEEYGESGSNQVQFIEDVDVEGEEHGPRKIEALKEERQKKQQTLSDLVQDAQGASSPAPKEDDSNSRSTSKKKNASEKRKSKRDKKKKKSSTKGSKSSKSSSSKRSKKGTKKEPTTTNNLVITWQRIKTTLSNNAPWRRKRNVALFAPSSSSEDDTDYERKARRAATRMSIEKAAAQVMQENDKNDKDSNTTGKPLSRREALNRKSVLKARRRNRNKNKKNNEREEDSTKHYDGDADDTHSDGPKQDTLDLLQKMPVSEALDEIMPLQAILSGDCEDCEDEDGSSFHRQSAAAAVAIAAASREEEKAKSKAKTQTLQVQSVDSQESNEEEEDLSKNEVNRKSILVKKGSISGSDDDMVDTNPGNDFATEKTKTRVKTDAPKENDKEPTSDTATSLVPYGSSPLLADTETSAERAPEVVKRDFLWLYGKEVKIPLFLQTCADCPKVTACCNVWNSANKANSEAQSQATSSSTFNACWVPSLENTPSWAKESSNPFCKVSESNPFCNVPESLYQDGSFLQCKTQNSSDELDMNYTVTVDTQDGDSVIDERPCSAPRLSSTSNLIFHPCGIPLERQQTEALLQLEDVASVKSEQSNQKVSKFDSIDYCHSAGDLSIPASCTNPFDGEDKDQSMFADQCNVFENSPLRILCADGKPTTLGSTWLSDHLKAKEVSHLELDSKSKDKPKFKYQEMTDAGFSFLNEPIQQWAAMPSERDVIENIDSGFSEGSLSEDYDSEDEESNHKNQDNTVDGVQLATEDLLKALSAPRGESQGESAIQEDRGASMESQYESADEGKEPITKAQSEDVSHSSSVFTPQEQSSMEDIDLSYTESNVVGTWSFEAQVNDKNIEDDAKRTIQAEVNLTQLSKSHDDDDNAPIIPSENKRKKPLSKFVRGMFHGKSARKITKMKKGKATKTEKATASDSKNTPDDIQKPTSLRSIASKESRDVSMSSLSLSLQENKKKNKKRSGSIKSGSSLDRKRLEQLVSDLMAHPHGFTFSSPVNLEDFPDYRKYVAKPMDLGTILKKLLSSGYPTLLEFHADVNRVFENAMKYNKEGSKVYNMALELKEIFEGQFLGLLDDLEAKLKDKDKA